MRGRAAGIRVSVVLPVLDEADQIVPALQALLAQQPDEVLVVDGGSADQTLALARTQAPAYSGRLRLLSGPRGRASQQNLGAARCSGDVILFLHVDTRLPSGGIELVRAARLRGARGGWFALALDARHPLARPTARLATWRSRLSGIATGDMGIFVARELFGRLGGFPEVPLLEDVLFTRRLRRHGPLIQIARPAVTSARRWERRGWLRTILWMWSARLAHAAGASPQWLAERYPVVR